MVRNFSREQAAAKVLWTALAGKGEVLKADLVRYRHDPGAKFVMALARTKALELIAHLQSFLESTKDV